MNEQLVFAYKYWRNDKCTALKALELARGDLALKRDHYTMRWHWQGGGNINPEHSAYGDKRLRWIEATACLRWRKVGLAHEIARREGCYKSIDHTGWYTRHDDYDEKTCGIVYALPARHGERLLVAGYTDPCNVGAACLSFDCLYSDEMEAARAADRLAELMAEESREYDEAWQAGSRWADLGRDARELRETVLATIREVKLAGKAMRGIYPTLCKAIAESISRDLRAITKRRKERAALMSNFGQHEAFADGAGT